jgi:hypothetical protein
MLKGRSSRSWINGRLTGSSLIHRQIDLGDSFLLGFCLRFPLFYCTCLVLTRVLVESMRYNFPPNFKGVTPKPNYYTTEYKMNRSNGREISLRV